VIGAAAFLWLELPAQHADREVVPIAAVLRDPAVTACAAAVVAASATISMLEPVLPLFLSSRLGIGPARIGLIFGIGAVVSTLAHPICGRLVNRWGGRRLTMIGLVLAACVLPILSHAWSYGSAIGFYGLEAATVALVITPSLAYMAEATSNAGLGSFGVGYGLYNMAWGAGLLSGPALGGFLFERLGFSQMALFWAPCVVSFTILLGRVKSKVPKGGPV
jgi:MFS family permease